MQSLGTQVSTFNKSKVVWPLSIYTLSSSLYGYKIQYNIYNLNKLWSHLFTIKIITNNNCRPKYIHIYKTHNFTHTDIFIHDTHTHIYTYIPIYTHIYTYIYTHTYIYIYIYIKIFSPQKWFNIQTNYQEYSINKQNLFTIKIITNNNLRPK